MSAPSLKPQGWPDPAARGRGTPDTRYFPDDLMTDRSGIIIPPVAQKTGPA